MFIFHKKNQLKQKAFAKTLYSFENLFGIELESQKLQNAIFNRSHRSLNMQDLASMNTTN